MSTVQNSAENHTKLGPKPSITKKRIPAVLSVLYSYTVDTYGRCRIIEHVMTCAVAQYKNAVGTSKIELSAVKKNRMASNTRCQSNQ
jgi:hypothetical protein